MLICGHVVDISTRELRYEPLTGRKAQLVWLQHENTVSVQLFRSVAVFPPHYSQVISTSSREDLQEPQGQTREKGVQHNNKKLYAILETKSIIGTLVCLVGFVT